MPLSASIKVKVLNGTLSARPLKEFGLKGRASVFINRGHCIKLIDRSSRFLRKDAETFLRELEVIAKETDKALVGHILIRRAPICSKARAFLEASGVSIEAVE